MAYLVYVALCLYWSTALTFARNTTRKDSADFEVAYLMCMIVLFLHLKGLVHDTWNSPASWLLTGAMVGTCTSLRMIPSRQSRRQAAAGTTLAMH